MIEQYCKKLKYKRRIVLITDGKGSVDPDGLEGIASKIKEEGIELVILWADPTTMRRNISDFCSGVDFDDPEFGFKEEDKEPDKVCSFCQNQP